MMEGRHRANSLSQLFEMRKQQTGIVCILEFVFFVYDVL